MLGRNQAGGLRKAGIRPHIRKGRAQQQAGTGLPTGVARPAAVLFNGGLASLRSNYLPDWHWGSTWQVFVSALLADVLATIPATLTARMPCHT